RLRLTRRNGRVARNHWRGYAAQGFDCERERSNVEEKEILHLASEHATLNRCADRDYFVGIDATVRLFAKQLLHQSLNARHASLSTDQDDFIDFARVHSRVFHTLLARPNGALDQVFYHRLQLGPGHLLDQMLGTTGIG